MNWYKIAQIEHYEALPIAGNIVDGLAVRPEVPNMASIEATFGNNYRILKGIRAFPMSMLGPEPTSLSNNAAIKNLAYQIKESGEINPLIIAIDSGGPYILEGSHRIDALEILQKKTIPALVVIGDLDNELV